MSLLDSWSVDHSEKFQKSVMTFKHRLKETGLFTDEALIALLEKHPSHENRCLRHAFSRREWITYR